MSKITGVVCSACGELESDVLDTRQNELGLRRRRKCRRCKGRFSSIEISYQDFNKLVRDAKIVKLLKEALQAELLSDE